MSLAAYLCMLVSLRIASHYLAHIHATVKRRRPTVGRSAFWNILTPFCGGGPCSASEGLEIRCKK